MRGGSGDIVGRELADDLVVLLASVPASTAPRFAARADRRLVIGGDDRLGAVAVATGFSLDCRSGSSRAWLALRYGDHGRFGALTGGAVLTPPQVGGVPRSRCTR